MPDRIVGGRVVPDRRKPIHTKPLQELAEPVLKERFPGIWKRAEADIDQLPRLLYDGVWRDHGNEIMADICAFADFHPVDEQRTDRAIKAWSQQCARELEGSYDQEYYRIAVHAGLLAYVRHMRKLRDKMTCEHGWHRIVERFHYACCSADGYGFIGAREKWGGLSLTYSCAAAGQEVCRAAESVAVEAAMKTCEKCGRRGELRRLHWRKTLCDQHFAERNSTMSPEECDALFEATETDEIKGRCRSVITNWHDDGRSSDAIYEHFLIEFGDLHPDLTAFVASYCTRYCLARRASEEGRLRDEGV